MNLVNWTPFREMESIFEHYGRPFRRSLLNLDDNEVIDTEKLWRPVADILETDDEYLIKAELPEVERKDVKVTLRDGVISISGERKFEETSDNEKTHRIESCYGRFSRSFALPGDADEEHVTAKCKDGVLKVHIRKTEAVKPKSIAVNVD
jgi:HSP20 family protein